MSVKRPAGPGSDLSEELVLGVEPAALDVRVAPECPLGPPVLTRMRTWVSRVILSTLSRYRSPGLCGAPGHQ